MRFVVVGLGSMGRRRIRLLQQISAEYSISGVDGREDRRRQAEEEFSIDTYRNLEEVFDVAKPEYAIVSTSPLSHADVIENCLMHDCHVFTELNLVDDKYESNMKLAKEKKRVLFMSSTFLYRDEIKCVREKVANSQSALNYNYHVGQYLPDWHPWESIKDYFVGEKRTNGCRELFAIELPWIIKTFGPIESYDVVSSKNTKLPIEYDDSYLLIINHVNGNKGVMSVDVVSRKAVRNLEIYGEDLYMTWDGTPSGLNEYDYNEKVDKKIELYKTVDTQKGYAAFVVENAYRNELEAFIKVTKGEAKAEHSFEEDRKILALIDEIESGDDR